jgi:hypothetical protein
LAPDPSKFPPGRESFDSGSDSAREFLESLERERGTKLLSESDYHELRRWVLLELEKGPHLRTSTLLTFGVVGLILFGFFVIGLAMLASHGTLDWLLAASSGCCLLLWGYLLWRYIAGVREQSRMSLQERLAELEDLRQNHLISQEEFEQIYAALHMSRGVPPQPEA